MGGGTRSAAPHGMTVPEKARVMPRRATGPDLEGVIAIERASFGDPWSAGSFRSLLEADHVYFPVVEEAGQVIAFAIALLAADQGEIANLAVAPAWRGRGIGARLLDDLLAMAEERGASTMWLEVRESNVAARRLYSSRGFTESGRRRHYYDDPVEDALVLKRTTLR